MGKGEKRLSAADEKAWRALRRIWDDKRGKLNLTQDAVAGKFGCSQGLIGQYLNGHTALGPVAVLKFARILEVQPNEIRDDVLLGTIIPSELPPDVRQLAMKLASLPEDVRRDAIGFFNTITQTGQYFNFVSSAEKAIKERPQLDRTDSTRHESSTRRR